MKRIKQTVSVNAHTSTVVCLFCLVFTLSGLHGSTFPFPAHYRRATLRSAQNRCGLFWALLRMSVTLAVIMTTYFQLTWIFVTLHPKSRPLLRCSFRSFFPQINRNWPLNMFAKINLWCKRARSACEQSRNTVKVEDTDQISRKKGALLSWCLNAAFGFEWCIDVND